MSKGLGPAHGELSHCARLRRCPAAGAGRLPGPPGLWPGFRASAFHRPFDLLFSAPGARRCQGWQPGFLSSALLPAATGKAMDCPDYKSQRDRCNLLECDLPHYNGPNDFLLIFTFGKRTPRFISVVDTAICLTSLSGTMGAEGFSYTKEREQTSDSEILDLRPWPPHSSLEQG